MSIRLEELRGEACLRGVALVPAVRKVSEGRAWAILQEMGFEYLSPKHKALLQGKGPIEGVAAVLAAFEIHDLEFFADAGKKAWLQLVTAWWGHQKWMTEEMVEQLDPETFERAIIRRQFELTEEEIRRRGYFGYHRIGSYLKNFGQAYDEAALGRKGIDYMLACRGDFLVLDEAKRTRIEKMWDWFVQFWAREKVLLETLEEAEQRRGKKRLAELRAKIEKTLSAVRGTEDAREFASLIHVNLKQLQSQVTAIR